MILGLPWRTFWLLFVALVLVIFAILDIVAATDRLVGNTFSENVLTFGRTYPIAALCLGVAIGVVLGHLFWPQFQRAP